MREKRRHKEKNVFINTSVMKQETPASVETEGTKATLHIIEKWAKSCSMYIRWITLCY